MFNWLKKLLGWKPVVQREWMLWIGDGVAPAGPHLIGTPVLMEGHRGKVIDTTALKVLVEWED